MSYTVAIVGRPNVGKSTFFNRLLEQRKAIVDDISGVTRDRQYGVADWNGKSFNLIDTGGFVPQSEDIFEVEIRKQVKIAIDEANAIIFMVDVATGITDLDEAMADLLRRSSKPVFVVVNKVDNGTRELEATEFYSLGFEHTFFISSISGSGTGDLLDGVVANITDEEGQESTIDSELPKFAIIGQPNVGKSSLLNALVGEERTIVSNIAGTTRDTIHTHYKLFQKEFMLIDTAGIRKKSKEKDDLEFYSIIRAIKAMDEADVCLLVIDAHKGITAQDITIFSLAARKGKGIVMLVNKWDLIEKETNTARDYEKLLKQKMAPFNDVPILFISVTEKTRIFKAIETGLAVFENRRRKIATSTLNEVMLKAVENYHAPVVRGHSIKIKFVTQLPTPVPSFAFFTNFPDDIKMPYKNYLENQLRANFDFKGVPIRIFFRKK
ncbi:MAG: ribosome biogenesis GTPase Der [Sphingobacteriia bacterium 24-36-13]|jgi:GTP-binding protein|uniref:ribosome biogenesis GTPase Der n=1 Tax=Sediminibacterium sp. TaxID=1917865 RepID=UPI000BCDB9A2|nr:ribosome biogenesis GTPase Der [Sediminibacterium sp.]OYY09074.1 MAG: ribosome biogenesis GTPase Der [Sphingobacteriia bacterium 35-36-14]OYZ52427.1 MAG: ribosome biogenesis GTPase Der [Sphingobacteriia bacterium 24-36-13]OZA63222.1 MAG: ribosome biogenesis GTPase Der [Sphingobacteriia bacterium 39-36-14]HQS25267.1 ribosome biogenesis GTPase Der [Sediminibacterium sp.]HQS35832.1 ribosome biogenesis GTPase Der [Sediminibacterium sp.]